MQLTTQGQPRPMVAISSTSLDLGTTTTRTTLLAPAGSRQLRITRIRVIVETAETSEKPLELYFGTGANAATDVSKIIDILTIKNTGTTATRTYDTLSLDPPPTGKRAEVLSYRWASAPINVHKAIIEYKERNTNRISAQKDLK